MQSADERITAIATELFGLGKKMDYDGLPGDWQRVFQLAGEIVAIQKKKAQPASP